MRVYGIDNVNTSKATCTEIARKQNNRMLHSCPHNPAFEESYAPYLNETHSDCLFSAFTNVE